VRKMAEPIQDAIWVVDLDGPTPHVLHGGAHYATWRIQMNRPCSAAMQNIVKLI